MIQNGKLTVATVIGAALLTTGFVLMTSPIEGNQAAAAYPMDQRGDHGYGYSHGKMKPGGYAAGTIASIQNDESGNPAWVLSGYWKASLTEGEALQHQTQLRLWEKICRIKLASSERPLTW